MIYNSELLKALCFFIYFFSISVKAQEMKGFDLGNAIIPVEFIKDGGPPRDGIPSIDDPEFVPTSEVSFMKDEDLLLAVNYNNTYKAYPVKILNFHEIVNDFFGDHPVVITFCPLCGSGVAFDAFVKGEVRTFGVSGLLYNSDVLLYDRQSETLWSQIMGEGVAGPLAGTKLSLIETNMISWKSWKAHFPFSEVLSTQTGYSRDYSRDPYPDYYSSEKIWFPVENENKKFHPKTRVLGINVNGKYKAYPYPELEKGNNLIEDQFNGELLRIRFDPGEKTAELLNQKDSIEAISLFWFAWIAFHPDTEVYGFKK